MNEFDFGGDIDDALQQAKNAQQQEGKDRQSAEEAVRRHVAQVRDAYTNIVVAALKQADANLKQRGIRSELTGTADQLECILSFTPPPPPNKVVSIMFKTDGAGTELGIGFRSSLSGPGTSFTRIQLERDVVQRIVSEFIKSALTGKRSV